MFLCNKACAIFSMRLKVRKKGIVKVLDHTDSAVIQMKKRGMQKEKEFVSSR